MFAWVQRRRSVSVSLLGIVCLFTGCARSTQPIKLSFHDVMVADVQPSQRGQRVIATGIVTYSDPDWHLLFVQDKDDAVYMRPPLNSDLHPGDHLQITGTTTDPSKLLEKTEFVVTSHSSLPEPVRLNNASEFTKYPSKFIEIAGTVRWAGIRNGRATLQVASGPLSFQAVVFPGTSEDLPRLGSEITIAGVSGGAYDDQGRLQSLQMLTPSARFIHVLKRGPEDPFSIAEVNIAQLATVKPGSLVRVVGKVMDRATNLLLIQTSRSVTVNLRRPLHGDFSAAEIVGFWTGQSIDDAMIRPTGELLAHAGDVRTLAELKHMSVAEASTRRHVSIRAVVTYVDPNWGLLFVQDRRAAAFVNTRGLYLRLRAGDLVDISGVSGPGDYAPVIAEPAVSFVGRGSLPVPIKLDLLQGNLAVADSQWCNFHGVVHSVDVSDGHTNLRLGAGEAAVNVQLPTMINGQQFLDKEVSVTGALGILFNERRQSVGHQIFVPDSSFLQVVGTGGKPNPESTIAVLRRYSPEFDEHHSVGIRGSVVLKGASNTIFIQDQTAGIQVRSVAPLNLNDGDRVAVRGFLRPGEYSPSLEDAVVGRIGKGALPDPEGITAAMAVDGSHDSEYVAMQGTLSAVRQFRNGVTLVLNDGGSYFEATGPASLDLGSLRLGSQIEVRGICQVTLDRTHVPFSINGFTMTFDSPASLRILKLGPWWTAIRVRLALILFAMFAAISVLWATMLRHKVHSKTQELQSSLIAKRKAQLFDQARNEVLESIASNSPLPESMERLALAIQEQVPGSVCAILMPPDGKVFLDGKAAPVFVAPLLSEEIQQQMLSVLLSVLSEPGESGSRHVSADYDLITNRLLRFSQRSDAHLTSVHTSPVFSSAGAVTGLLILFLRADVTIAADGLPQGILHSASRLISLAHDHWQMHERLLHEARHDGLTGLPNRIVGEDRLEQALARAERRHGSFAVFCIDLDGFKGVNDDFGHDAGDELLRIVSARLRSRVRHSDTLARIGGDEFLAIIEDCSRNSAAQSVADSLISSLRETLTLEDRQLTLSASIGVAMYPADGKNAAQLRRNADQAMYRAKNNGGGQACFWSGTPDPSGKTSLQSKSAAG
jgi:diguanylate cyclase (GGDEF)-like protein